MPNGFLEGIRFSNIYRPPQYRKIEPSREEIPNFPQQGRVGQIAQQVAGRDPNVTPQMDVVFKPEAGTKSEILRQSNLRASPEFELAKEQLGAQYGYRGRQLDIQQQRADAYTFKTQNPNAIIREVGGRMVAINPQNPSQTVDLGDSRFMDEADKLALQQTGRLELEGTRQTGRESLLKTRGEQEMEQIGARGVEARRTQEERPELATQQARQIQNKYNILINRRPELRDFVKLDPASGMPMVTPAGQKGFFGRVTGPTKEQFDEINQFLFGETRKETPPETKAETGIVQMKTPDGRIIQVPTNQVDEAKKRGATTVSGTSSIGELKGLPPLRLIPSHRRGQ